jgi:hypothetical protein
MARRPSRFPIGLGRSAPRLGGTGPCIVKVERQFHFAFLDKWLSFCRYSFIDYKIIYNVIALTGGLWRLLRLLTVFNPRGTSARIADRCVDMCTWSKRTRSNLRSSVSYMVEL